MSDQMAQRLEEIVEAAKERLLGLQDAIDGVVGDMPFGGRKMNPDEALAKWMAGRNDSAFWLDLIQQRQAHHNLPPETIPKDIIDYDKTMMARLRGRLERVSGDGT